MVIATVFHMYNMLEEHRSVLDKHRKDYYGVLKLKTKIFELYYTW
jgi:hypothetical protein